MMKMMKLMMVTSIATLSVMSAFVEPAEAQAVGAGYDVMGTDEMSIGFQFELFKTTTDGKPIFDREPSKKIGLFKGAIQDFTTGSKKLRSAESGLDKKKDYDPSGYPIYEEEQSYQKTRKLFTNGDLLVELITEDSKLADPKQCQKHKITCYIRYSIFEKYGRTQRYISFILDPSQLGTTFKPLSRPINLDRAVNNLAYIVDHNLLDAVIDAATADSNAEIKKLLLDTIADSGPYSLIKSKNLWIK